MLYGLLCQHLISRCHKNTVLVQEVLNWLNQTIRNLMPSLSVCDKDLQPMRADCQKLLMFTSKFLGLVYISEPRDWLACSVGPRTNCLWHHFHGTQLQATFYVTCLCVCVSVRDGIERGTWFCSGLVSLFSFVIYHVKMSKYHGWQMGSMCNQLSSFNEPIRFVGGLLSVVFKML